MAVKKAVSKTAKKAAKKTYPPAKKTFPKSRLITVEDLTNIFIEASNRMEANHAKTEASIRDLSVERAKTEASIRELSAENRKLSAEHAKTEAAIRELSAENRELSRNLGHIGNDIGELTEFIVIPKIRLAMNASGKHAFDNIQTDKLYKKIDELGEKKTLTEVDVLLCGETEVMAVETKTHPLVRDVKKHQERLEILRQHEDLVGIKGKKLFGAVVGAIVDPEVKTFALARGLYVVNIREEEEKLEIAEPETCRAW